VELSASPRVENRGEEAVAAGACRKLLGVGHGFIPRLAIRARAVVSERSQTGALPYSAIPGVRVLANTSVASVFGAIATVVAVVVALTPRRAPRATTTTRARGFTAPHDAQRERENQIQ
jgi:hypothetical protein